MRSLWGSDPLVVPRWMLTGLYGGFVVLGACAAAFGSPTLELTTPHGYTGIWGLVVAASASVAVAGSMSTKREPLERWASTVLVSFVFVWAVYATVLLFGGGPDTFSRATFTIVVLMVTGLPGVRVGYLLRQAGVKRK